jgi:hypothetical protein
VLRRRENDESNQDIAPDDNPIVGDGSRLRTCRAN